MLYYILCHIAVLYYIICHTILPHFNLNYVISHILCYIDLHLLYIILLFHLYTNTDKARIHYLIITVLISVRAVVTTEFPPLAINKGLSSLQNSK